MQDCRGHLKKANMIIASRGLRSKWLLSLPLISATWPPYLNGNKSFHGSSENELQYFSAIHYTKIHYKFRTKLCANRQIQLEFVVPIPAHVTTKSCDHTLGNFSMILLLPFMAQVYRKKYVKEIKRRFSKRFKL